MDSTKRNIIYNGIAHSISKVVRVLQQLLLVPFFLNMWGTAYYGEWLTLITIPSFLAFADFGFGTATGNGFVLRYAGGDKQQASNYFHTGFRMVSITVISGIVFTTILMFVAWITGLLDRALISPEDCVLSIVFMMGARFVTFYLQVFEAFYRASRRAALSTNLLTVEVLLRIIAGIVVLLMGYKVVAYSIGQFVSVSAFMLFYALYGKSLIKDLPKGRWIKDIASETFKKGLAFLANPTWRAIYFQGSTFIVRIILGPDSVAVFNTVRTACRSINQMFIIVSQSIYPEIQLAIGRNDLKVAQKIFSKALRLLLLVAFIGIACLFLFGREVYNWWTHNMLQVPNILWYMFMIGILFNALWETAGTLFQAANKPYKLAVYSLISAILSVSVSWILTYPFELLGACIGYVLLDILMVLLVFPSACKLINLDWKTLILKKVKCKDS